MLCWSRILAYFRVERCATVVKELSAFLRMACAGERPSHASSCTCTCSGESLPVALGTLQRPPNRSSGQPDLGGAFMSWHFRLHLFFFFAISCVSASSVNSSQGAVVTTTCMPDSWLPSKLRQSCRRVNQACVHQT